MEYVKNTEYKRIIFLLHCYTDGDWCFKKEPETRDWDNWNPCFVGDYKNHRTNVDEFGDSYEYNFAFTIREHDIPNLIHFLEDLKRDLDYDENGHTWARKEIDDMINPAIDFLKSQQDGTYFGTVKDGNWQPTALVINIKTYTY